MELKNMEPNFPSLDEQSQGVKCHEHSLAGLLASCVYSLPSNSPGQDTAATNSRGGFWVVTASRQPSSLIVWELMFSGARAPGLSIYGLLILGEIETIDPNYLVL